MGKNLITNKYEQGRQDKQQYAKSEDNDDREI